jgi:hypothetical protein
MGIDRHFAEFLIAARDGGIDFGRVATIGRLNLFADFRSLKAAFARHGLALADGELRRLRADGYSDAFLRHLGAKELTAIDASSYEGASIIHDLNRPIDRSLVQRYSVVIDGGTLEHIFDFASAIRNCMEMLEVGGHFFCHTMANNFLGHGFYQFSPELFYRVFSPENGFRVLRMIAFESMIGRPKWYQPADPQLIGERVELVNTRPTYLLVHAQRIADVPLFASAPCQADYSRHWSLGEAPSYAGSGLRSRIHRWGKSKNDLLMRWLPGFAYDYLLSALVRGLPRRGFRRRQYSLLPDLRSSGEVDAGKSGIGLSISRRAQRLLQRAST